MPSLLIDIEARFAQFQDSLDKMVGQTKKAGDSMAAAMSGFKSVLSTLGVGLSIGAFAAFIKSAADSQDKLRELSITTGITVEKLGALRGIAKTAGTDIETVAEAMAKLARNMSTSGENTATVSGAFKFLGISARDSSGNLKPISDVMVEIAKKLNGFQDGAGKAAIVMDLFGRGAAHLIPYLKELGEATDLTSKVTQKAVEEAHRFEVQMREFEKQSLAAKTALANSLIPTITDFLEQLVKGRDIFGGFVSALAALGTTNPFQSNAEAIAGYNKALDENNEKRALYIAQHRAGKLPALDEERKQLEKLKEFAQFMQRQDVNRGVKALGDIRDANDLRAQFKDPLNYNRKDPKNISEDAGLGALADARAKIITDREKKTGEFLQALLDRQHSQALISEENYWAERFRIQDHAADVDIQAEEKRVATRQRILNDSLARGDKPSIQNAAQKGLEEAQAALEEKRAEKQTKRILLTSDANIAAKKLEDEANQDRIKSANELSKVSEDAKKVLDDYVDAQRIAANEEKFQVKLIGETAVEQAKLNGVRKIGLDLDRALAALPEGAGEVADKLRKAADEATKAFLKTFAEFNAKSRDMFTGAKDALNDYIDHATNSAELTKNVLVNAFKSAEDALVNFTKTGKLDFKSFANSVIEDLIRIQAKQTLAKVASSALDWIKLVIGGGGGAPAPDGGSGLGLSGVFEGRAGGGAVRAGTSYMVGERGPEIFQPSTSGTIIPHGGGVGTVNINFMGGPPTDQQTFLAAVIPIIKSVSRGEISDQLRDGGVLARAT